MPVSEETPVVLPLANHDMSDWPTTTEPELPRTRHGNRRWLKAIEWSGQIIPMLPKAILGLLVVVMGSVILWASMKAVFDGRAAVEPISVSEEWGKRGFTGTALSQRLLDEISRINQVAKTSKQRAQFGGGQSSVLANIQVPQTSLNVQAIVTILRDLFGQDETRIGGELMGEPGKDLSLVIRTEHKAVRHAQPLTDSDVDKLIKKAAVEVLRRIDPYVLASYYYQRKQFEEMDSAIDEILAKSDDSVRVWALNLRGISLADQRRYDEAVTYYNRAIRLDNRFSNGHLNRGNVESDRGDYESALASYKKAHANDQNSYLPLYNWGVLLINLGEYEDAFSVLHEAMLRDPTQPLPHRALGGLWERMSNFDRAAAAYEKAFEMARDDFYLLARLGGALYRKGDEKAAEARFNGALRRLFKGDVYNAWGDALLFAGKRADARQQYANALNAGPWDAFAHTRIGRSWIDDNRFDYAEASCQAATTLDADSSIAHVYCGDMYTKKGDSRSLQHYQRAVALAPNNASVLISLANHYYATGDSSKGASAFDRARKISPGSRSIYLNWGNWLHSSNDHAGALEMYDAAIRVYPANDEAYAARVKPLQQLGMTLEAEKSESKAKAIRERRNALLSPSNSSTLSMVEPYSRLRTPILP